MIAFLRRARRRRRLDEIALGAITYLVDASHLDATVKVASIREVLQMHGGRTL